MHIEQRQLFCNIFDELSEHSTVELFKNHQNFGKIIIQSHVQLAFNSILVIDIWWKKTDFTIITIELQIKSTFYIIHTE